jgi:hypothetical protein
MYAGRRIIDRIFIPTDFLVATQGNWLVM